MPASILSAEEVKQLISSTSNISIKLDMMSESLKEMREDQKAEQTLARQNMDRLSRIENSHEDHHRRITDNFEQHKNDFYPRITALENRVGILETVMNGQEKEDSRTEKKLDEIKIIIEKKIDDHIEADKIKHEATDKKISDIKTRLDVWTGAFIMIGKVLGVLGLLSGIVFGILRLI